MPPNIIVIVIIAVAVLGIVAGIGYYIARFMRGSIKLSIIRTAYGPGEMIEGNFDLLTKKTLQGNKLVVRLIGTQITKTRDSDGDTKTRSREIYRNEVVLEEAKTYPSGYSETHEFEIPTPDIRSPDFMDSSIGRALSSAIGMLNDRSTRLKWKVEARLDAKGVDLATSKAVTVNTRM